MSQTIDVTKVKLSAMSLLWLFVGLVVLIFIGLAAWRAALYLEQKAQGTKNALVAQAGGGNADPAYAA